MKNRLLLLILLAFMPCLLPAQVTSWAGHVGSTDAYVPGRSIVRSWGDHHLVVYYEDSTLSGAPRSLSLVDVNGFTSYFTITGITQTVSLMGAVTLQDMCIEENYLFFCGSYNPSGGGIYGWADLSTSPVAYGYCMVDDTICNSLDKLAVKKVNDKFALYAIGSRQVPATSVIVYNEDALTSGAIEYAELNDISHIQREILDDVTITNNVAVFAGRDMRINQVTMRCIPMGAHLTAPVLSTLNMLSEAALPLTSTVHATAVRGDTVALTYVRGGNDVCMLCFCVADAPVSIVNGHHVTSISGLTMDIADVAYVRHSDQLALLWPTSGPMSLILMLHPLETTVPYTTQALQNREKIYSSLDALGLSSIAVWGSKGFGLQNCTVPLNVGSTNSCMVPVEPTVLGYGVSTGILIDVPEVKYATSLVQVLTATLSPSAGTKTCERP